VELCCNKIYREVTKKQEVVMAEEIPVGCARPTGSVVGEKADSKTEDNVQSKMEKEVPKTMLKVGKKAPDFTAPAYHKGKFINVTLSEHLGKWVVLCFYPGDFTFV